jgi:hypothetical protein
MPPVRTHVTVSIEAIDAGAASVEHLQPDSIPHGNGIHALPQCRNNTRPFMTHDDRDRDRLSSLIFVVQNGNVGVAETRCLDLN